MEDPTEDTEVLRAVMAFLDEKDVDFPEDHALLQALEMNATPPNSEAGSGSPCASDSESIGEMLDAAPSSSASSSAPATNAGGRRGGRKQPFPRVINRSRMRRRHEVISLREQVIALEQRLEAIKASEGGGESEAATASGEDDEVKKLRVMAWQAVAECQRDQLDAAEKEREKLRQLVKEYKLSIKRVERLLKKQTLPGSLFLANGPLENHDILDMDSPEGFEDISCNIPTMYLQINGVFKDTRLDSLVGGIRDVRVQNEKTANMSIEVLDSRILPFDVATTAKAMWHFQHIKASKVTHAVEEEIEESEDFMRRRFLATLHMPHYKGQARGRMETRRFIEKDRVVIVQCAIFDQTLRMEGGDVKGSFGIRQFHWTVIGPPHNEKLRESGRPVSQIETFEVSIPFQEDKGAASDPQQEHEEMKNFCVDAAHFILELESQAVENILMNLSLNK